MARASACWVKFNLLSNPRKLRSDRMPGMTREPVSLWTRWQCAALACLTVLCISLLYPFSGNAQTSSAVKAKHKSISANLAIAPDLEAQLAKFKPVHMPYDSARLTPRERQLVAKLVEACQAL